MKRFEMSFVRKQYLFGANQCKLVIIIFIFIHVSPFSFSQSKIISISPIQTDIRIKTFTADSHRVFTNDRIPKRGELMVYLPASFYSTNSANLFCTMASDAGYRVISLAYPGTDKMDFTCQHSTDPACFENFHREIIDGKDYSPNIQVDSLEGIMFRLKALLIYLHKVEPGQGWNEYLENNTLKQSSIIWSGHSDAAGHVAVLAKYYSIKRAICFSGPMDFSLHYYLPPIWLNSGIWKTDKANIYVFGHVSDEYTFQKEIWDSLGINKYGKNTNINQSAYPYTMSHSLITSAPIAIGDVHECTVLDAKTPMDKNKPVFELVWKYMLDISLATTPIKAIDAGRTKISPNPLQSGENLNIESNIPSFKIDLYSRLGQSIYSGKVEQGRFTLPIIPSGVYFLKIETKEGNEVIKLLIK